MNKTAAAVLAALVTAGSFMTNAVAADWGLCAGPLVLPQRPAPDVQVGDPELTHVSADDADLVEEGTSVLIGNVQILKGQRQVQADRVELTRPERIIDAEGNIRLWDDGLYVHGDKGHIKLDADAATLDNADFILLDEHGSGTAEHVVLTGGDLVTATEAAYTTCDPHDVEWLLEADSIKLDRVTEFGSARNVFVMLKGVPIFYSPYMTFPLSDKRKTGFLTPSMRLSGETGFEFILPYYWNIAPERDATLTARTMTKRGVQLQGEYRYLSHYGDGELGVEYLPHDRERDDDRAALSFQHEGDFAPGWSTDVDVDWVSDKEYFEDLGTNLAIASRRFLERRADLRYTHNRWRYLARVQDYQTIDRTISSTRRPYKRLPQLLATYTPLKGNRRFNLGFRGETVYFDRADPSVTGVRYDLKPSVSYPMRTAWTFLEPKASLQYTGYDLSGQAAGLSDNPDRLLPILSTDAGLFFERDLEFGGRGFVQTLEPRLFYLYVPREGQDDLPDFDTAVPTFSFAQLFRDNRFSGADRVGDANQLSLALTSRLLTPQGEEWLRASVGQIVYFEDREIQLVPGTPRETDSTSDIVGELAASVWDDWRFAAGFQWDTDEARTDRNTFRLRYQPDLERVLNLEYRFVREAVEQTDMSARWPLNHNWSMVGRWNYSLPESKTLEAFGGFEYDNCCWATRFVVRRFLRDINGDFDTGVFFQLELKGLAGIGDAGEFLHKSIPGYQNTF